MKDKKFFRFAVAVVFVSGIISSGSGVKSVFSQSTVIKAMSEETSADELTALNEVNKKKDRLIQISAEVVEIRTKKAQDLGVKWVDTIQTGEISWLNDTRVPQALPEMPSLFRIGEYARWTAIKSDIHMLAEKGAAKILATPKLVSKNETNARVMVGGEIPYAVATAQEVTVEWKEYGVKLDIIPTIVGSNQIGLSLYTEVSEIDKSNSISLGNSVVPAMIKRRASTTVLINDGESIAIAGLTRNYTEEFNTGVPYLMDIPLLGYLFKWKQTRDEKTNVVVFITPTIVKEGITIEKLPY